MVIYSWVHVLFKDNPLGYHLLNILLGVGAGFLVFLILREWFSSAQAALAALVFSVQPVHVEAIAWIAALPELLSAVLVLGGFRLHLRKVWSRHDYVISGIIFFLQRFLVVKML